MESKGSSKAHRVTARKQAELNELAAQVRSAGFAVSEMQAVVDSLNLKQGTFQVFLAQADNTRITALANLQLLNTAVSRLAELKENSLLASATADGAAADSAEMALQVSSLINDLIFAGEVVDKLAAVLNRQRALNPLISSDLITRVATAVADTHDAVALTLTALQSAYAARPGNDHARATMRLELDQVNELLALLTGADADYQDLTRVDTAFARVQAADAGVRSQLDQVAAANGACEGLSKALIATTDDIAASEASIEALESSIHTELESELIAAQQDLERRLVAANRKLQSALQDLAAAAEADKMEKQKVVDSAQQNAAELDAQLAQATAKVRKLEAANAAATNSINQLQETVGTQLQLRAKQIEDRDEAIGTLAANFDSLEAATALLTRQLANFDKLLHDAARGAGGQKKSSLQYLLTRACRNAVSHFDAALKASDGVTREFEAASRKLMTTTNRLASLHAGLDAATAAAHAG